ncbi:MAG: hypothetical protein LBB63_00030 [Holosporaceae bacterium]|jgi:hypothetical protein|nr:hypothetical protein [Holosporaceae bacterium]
MKKGILSLAVCALLFGAVDCSEIKELKKYFKESSKSIPGLQLYANDIVVQKYKTIIKGLQDQCTSFLLNQKHADERGFYLRCAQLVWVIYAECRPIVEKYYELSKGDTRPADTLYNNMMESIIHLEGEGRKYSDKYYDKCLDEEGVGNISSVEELSERLTEIEGEYRELLTEVTSNGAQVGSFADANTFLISCGLFLGAISEFSLDSELHNL